MPMPDQQLGIRQRPVMTPQLQLAYRLLQLPALELQAQLQEALDSNVMLQPDESFDATWTLETENPVVAPELREAPGATLRDHLAWQLEAAPLPNGPRTIGRALIEAINDDGYLTETTAAIAAAVAGEVRAEASVVDSVLAIIQQFDPAGVGARSVAECVELQLAQLEPATPGLDAARKIARHHLDLVAGQQLLDLHRLTGYGGTELELAIALVRSCHRRPGAAFHSPRAEYVVPDVIARRAPVGWTVELNPAATPRVRLNERYAAMVTGSPDQAALRAQLQEARWLVRSLEIRDDILLKVARAIVDRQEGFLERSEACMRPMSVRDVAEAVDAQESAVSRATTGKYLHPPRGVLEFRLFFGTGRPGAPMPWVSKRFGPSARYAQS